VWYYGTQGLILGKQVLYHLNTLPALFGWVFFEIRSYELFPGLAEIFLISAF
jgi:hypothetical protein